MGQSNKIIELSLSSFNKLDKSYPKWIKSNSFVVILSTRLTTKQLLSKLKGDISNVIVIDCVSKSKHQQSITVDGLNSLTSMALTISAIMKKTKVDLLVIDSLSSLIIHNDPIAVLKFANDISQKSRAHGCKLILPVLKKDQSEALSPVELYVDKVEKS